MAAHTFDTTAEGWTAGAGAPTVARSTSGARSGAGCLLITATAAGTAEAKGVLEPVTPGQTVSASLYVRPGVNRRDVQAYVNWYTAGDAYISSSSGADAVYANAASLVLDAHAYQALNANAPDPASVGGLVAAKSRLHVVMLNAAAGDTLRLDDVIVTTTATAGGGTTAPSPSIGSGFFHVLNGVLEPLDLYLGDGPSSTGRFSATGGVIKDPVDQTFVPMGVNLLGHDAFWTTDPLQLVDEALAWGYTAVRLNSMLPGEDYSGFGQYTMAGTAAAPAYLPSQAFIDRVEAFTDAGIVVIDGLFLQTPGAWPTEAQMLKAESRWTGSANVFRDNELVWFNLLNEPGSELAVPVTYFNIHKRLQDKIRATGATNLIVIDGTQWGQDHQYDTSKATVPTSESGILTYGAQLKANDPVVGGTAFSIHPYATYGTSADPAYNDAKLADFVDRVRAAGLSLIFGEAGSYGNATLAEANDSTYFRRGAEAAHRVGIAKGVGLLAWHGTPGDGFNLVNEGGFHQINSPTNPSNLTWHGRILWDRLHGGLVAPGVPTIGTASSGAPGAASVAFTAGNPAGTSYTATSSPGGYTATGTSSPVTVTGLPGGSYTFKVKANRPAYVSAESAASNSVSVTQPASVTIQNTDTGTGLNQVEFSSGWGVYSSWTYNNAPGAFTIIRGTGTAFTVYGPHEGATFRWRVDGGAWTSVTSNAQPDNESVHQILAVTGLSNAAHALELEVVSPGRGNLTGAVGIDYVVVS